MSPGVERIRPEARQRGDLRRPPRARWSSTWTGSCSTPSRSPRARGSSRRARSASHFDAAVSPSLVGRTFSDCRTLILEHHGPGYPVDTLMGAWHGAYDDLVEREGLVLKPGLHELVDWLERERVPRAVATSTRRTRACAKLERVALLSRFAALVGGDEIARGKPAPDIFLEAAARLGVAARGLPRARGLGTRPRRARSPPACPRSWCPTERYRHR